MGRKTYNTPHRDCIVKTRLTAEERKEFEEICRTFSVSQSEYLRKMIFYGKVKTTVRVTANSDELMGKMSELVSQYGKIGANLNQIARHLNGGGAFYSSLADEVRAAAADLAALKFDVLKMAGEAYGNDKTYQL